MNTVLMITHVLELEGGMKLSVDEAGTPYFYKNEDVEDEGLYMSKSEAEPGEVILNWYDEASLLTEVNGTDGVEPTATFRVKGEMGWMDEQYCALIDWLKLNVK